jgi:prepilin-type N-terminal cleavage/methylation domain-containing protein
MRRGPLKRAFTLIELLTVIAIIMVVMAMALPSFWTMMNSRRWAEAVVSLENVVRRCRSLALNDKRDYSVEICATPDNATQYFRIEKESALLETIPELNAYFQQQCDCYLTQMPVDWYLAFQAGGGTITPSVITYRQAPELLFEYHGPVYDVSVQSWGLDQRIEDNLKVDDSNVLPSSIHLDLAASANVVNFDPPPLSNNDLPQYGWDYTPDLRFDARGTLVQTRNPELVLRNRTGESMRLQVLRSTGRMRKLSRPGP